MEATGEQAELFPTIAEQAARPSTASVLRSYVNESLRHGFLVPIYLAAEALEVSRQRVHQLIHDRQLPAVQCGDRKFIPADALDLFLTEDRKTGIHVSRRWLAFGGGKAVQKKRS
jgi:excisionase family DNA binding protein